MSSYICTVCKKVIGDTHPGIEIAYYEKMAQVNTLSSYIALCFHPECFKEVAGEEYIPQIKEKYYGF